MLCKWAVGCEHLCEVLVDFAPGSSETHGGPTLPTLAVTSRASGGQPEAYKCIPSSANISLFDGLIITYPCFGFPIFRNPHFSGIACDCQQVFFPHGITSHNLTPQWSKPCPVAHTGGNPQSYPLYMWFLYRVFRFSPIFFQFLGFLSILLSILFSPKVGSINLGASRWPCHGWSIGLRNPRCLRAWIERSNETCPVCRCKEGWMAKVMGHGLWCMVSTNISYIFIFICK